MRGPGGGREYCARDIVATRLSEPLAAISWSTAFSSWAMAAWVSVVGRERTREDVALAIRVIKYDGRVP